MTTIQSILDSKTKPKEKVTLLSETIIKNKKAVIEIIKCFENGSDSEKGSCVEALEYATRQNPRLGEHCIDFAIAQLAYKAPRVKWEAAKVIGNSAISFPKETAKAVSKLLTNTKDEGTVVRWSAAFALTEIAKRNPACRKKLIPEFKKIIAKEKSNGVKNIYAKAMKVLQKS